MLPKKFVRFLCHAAITLTLGLVFAHAEVTIFSLDAASFTYNGSVQGPTVTATPSDATFTTGGTLSATNAGNYTATATATGLYTGSNNSLAWSITKAAATVNLEALNPAYNGAPLQPRVNVWGFVRTIAGAAGGPGWMDGLGAAASFDLPSGLAVDGAGNVFVADTINSTIRKITPDGTVTTVAGTARTFGSTDGNAGAASFSLPHAVAVDASGNLYVADMLNYTIRKITPTGEVTTFAGKANNSGTADGTGDAARFGEVQGVAVDETGNVYVGDTSNHTIRKITPAGAVSTLAGSAGNPGAVDATGVAARFSSPRGLAVDPSGNVYVADLDNKTIRKIAPDGTVTTIAGMSQTPGTADGIGTAARFMEPWDVTRDGAGNLYVADAHVVRKIASDGTVTTLAGIPGSAGGADGIGSAARFIVPRGVAADSAGTVYVADTFNYQVRKISPAGEVTTLAGTQATMGSQDGPGTMARFFGPRGAAVDSAGNVYLADEINNTIRKISSGGIVTTLAGDASAYGSEDGTGNAARFLRPTGVALDGAGNVYVADRSNHTIRKITPAGVVTTLAGNAGLFSLQDGTGTSAQFNYPTGLAADGNGDLYVADTSNQVIRKVTTTGVVTTIAGFPGLTGREDGTGIAARFTNPTAVAVDGAGNIYVADTGNHLIRKISPAGVVTTLAGGTVAGSSDGIGTNAQFRSPNAIALDAGGSVYVTDAGNQTIRKITPEGMVSTIAGSVGLATVVDGTLSAARFYAPAGIGVDGSGNLYVADSGGQTIRKITTASGSVTLTYNGGAAIPTNAGTYAVAATLDDPNYTGSAFGTFIVSKASQSAPVITSASSIRSSDSYTATATTGYGAIEWALGSGSSAGLSINLSTGIVGYTTTGTFAIKARFTGDANHEPSPYSSDLLLTVARRDDLVVFGDSNFPTPSTLWPGATVTFSQNLTNAGTEVWSSDYRFILQDEAGNTVATSYLFGPLALNALNTANFSFITPIIAGTYHYHIKGRAPDGSLFGATSISFTIPSAGITRVSAGYSESAFIDASGTLWVAGASVATYGRNEVIGWPNALTSDVSDVAFGVNHVLFLGRDGVAWYKGMRYGSPPGSDPVAIYHDPIVIFRDVVAVSAGQYSDYFLGRDGRMWAMGRNQFGQLADGTMTYRTEPTPVVSQVQAMAAGGSRIHFLKADSSLWAAGLNQQGALGDGTSNNTTTPVQIATNVRSVHSHNSSGITAFIKTDGTLWVTGQIGLMGITGPEHAPTLTPLQVADDVVEAAVGYSSILYLKSDGSLWGWGDNHYGHLGLGDASIHPSPAQVATNVATIDGSTDHTVFAKNDGSLWVMGSDRFGQLGNGPDLRDDQLNPVRIGTGVLTSPQTPTEAKAVPENRMLRLNWTPSLGAAYYEIWRNTANDPATATRIASRLKTPLYYDQEIIAGGTYYYWIKAINPAGASAAATLTVRQPVTVDFNGDGEPDLVLQNLTTGARSLRLMNGTTLVGETALGALAKEWFIATTGDFNSDGQSDLLLQNSQTGERAICLMHGAIASADVSLGSVPVEWSIAAAADFNSDGKTDILWQNTTTGERYLWFMDGTTHVGDASLGTVPVEWSIAAAADFNDDGKSDILWQNTTTGERYLWFMDGTTALGHASLGTEALDWHIAAAADYNDDDKTDILWQNTVTGQCYLWFMNGTTRIGAADLGLLPAGWSLAGVPVHQSLVSTHDFDFNGDGKADILWQNTTTGERYLWFMNGSIILGRASLGTVALEWSIATAADFNGDDKPDILWQNTTTGERYLWFMNGSAQVGGVSLGTVALEWSIAAAADFNGDGKTDILWQNTTTGERYVWFMDGSAHIGDAGLGTVALEWSIAAAADFNGDGKPDILWQNTTTGERYLWLMNGTTGIGAAGLGIVPAEWSIAAAADFNGDGKPDILWQNTTTGERYLWFMDGTTTLRHASLGTEALDWHIVN